MDLGAAEWGTALEAHRRHQGFHTEGWVFERQMGFTCRCDGREQTWKIPLSSLKECPQEVRDTFTRLYAADRRRDGIRNAREERKAQKRAKALLHKYLSKEQRWSLRARGFFDVTGQDGLPYRVKDGTCQNVFLLEDGEETTAYCAIPVNERIPTNDLMLAHKVMLESDIQVFMKVARRREKGSLEWQGGTDANGQAY